jgi:hypothetical protein
MENVSNLGKCEKCGATQLLSYSICNYNGMCNGKVVPFETTRQMAMSWWNKLKYDSPAHLEFYAKKHFDRPWNTLTGREVEIIWNNEK